MIIFYVRVIFMFFKIMIVSSLTASKMGPRYHELFNPLRPEQTYDIHDGEQHHQIHCLEYVESKYLCLFQTSLTLAMHAAYCILGNIAIMALC